MLQARLWGRPTLAWALDVAVVVLALALLLLGDSTLQLLGVLMLLWRLVSVALGVLLWRRTAEGARSADPRNVSSRNRGR